jgi:hypothetical protein
MYLWALHTRIRDLLDGPVPLAVTLYSFGQMFLERVEGIVVVWKVAG